MFTNINTKSLKGFLYCKFLDVIPIILVIMVIAEIGFTIYGFHILRRDLNKELVSVEQSIKSISSELKIAEDFYFQVGLNSMPSKPVTEEEPEEQLTGKALYLQYISEIVDTHYPDLDCDIIAAIVYHESRFQPDVKNSKSGATGLMQILPKWHTDRARQLGVTDLSDPYGNLLVGCDILNEVYQQSNSMDYALDVYAGGYQYADSYRNSVSPYRLELEQILQSDVL